MEIPNNSGEQPGRLQRLGRYVLDKLVDCSRGAFLALGYAAPFNVPPSEEQVTLPVESDVTVGHTTELSDQEIDERFQHLVRTYYQQQ